MWHSPSLSLAETHTHTGAHVHWNDKALNIGYNEKQRSRERMKRAYVSPSRTVCKSSSPFSDRGNFTSFDPVRSFLFLHTHDDQAVQRAKRQRFREMKHFASSLPRNMCGLSAETFSFSFNLTDIFYADTYLHFNEGSVKESYK